MIRLLLAGLVGLLALGAASADVVTRSANLVITDMTLAALDSIDQEGPDPGEVATDGPVGDDREESRPRLTTVQDVLLVGTDSREGLTHDEMREMDAFDHGGALTDTIIWVQYLPDSGSVRMVAFPRDIAVTTASGRAEKINALHPIDGPNALIEELEELVGKDLDHYVEVDLDGLVTLTDAVGGVEVCLAEPLVDETVGVIPAGRQVLGGVDAGRFVRARKTSDSFGAGTFGRAARQQYFLSQALDKVLSIGTLTDPAALQSLVQVASRAVVVDDGLSLTGMYELANVFRSVDPQAVESAIVPVVAYTQDGLYYERVAESAEELFAALRTGAPLPEEARSEREDDDVDGRGVEDGGGEGDPVDTTGLDIGEADPDEPGPTGIDGDTAGPPPATPPPATDDGDRTGSDAASATASPSPVGDPDC